MMIRTLPFLSPRWRAAYFLIHLADNEWGNEVMRRVAQEWFDANPALQFIQVYEHAGWSLGFRRDGSVWSTANDMAVLDKGSRPTELMGWDRRDTGSFYLHPEVQPVVREEVA